MRAVIEWHSNNRASFSRQIPRIFLLYSNLSAVLQKYNEKTAQCRVTQWYLKGHSGVMYAPEMRHAVKEYCSGIILR